MGNYFNKYKILYDKAKDGRSLSEIAQAYKDAATENTKYFGENVDRIVREFTSQIQKQNSLVRNDINGFFTNLQHKLRQLELKGQLSKDKIESVLDSAHTEAVRQKIMTESEWQRAYRTFKSSYQTPAWYQRLLGVKATMDDGASSLNSWIQSVIDRVTRVGGLTKEQAKAIRDEVSDRITNTDINHLGDQTWVDEVSESIAAKTELSKDQLEKVMDTIKHDVNGYKIFGLEYTGQAKEKAKNLYEKAKHNYANFWDGVHGYFRQARFRINHFWKKYDLNQKKEDIVHATESVKSAASSFSEDWHSSSKSMARSRTIHSVLSKASEMAAEATQKIQDLEHLDLKETFGHFWREKEHNYYRKLGYTEAHLDWIQDYLVKTFTNQKKSVRDKVDEAGTTIKSYLDALKIQTPGQNEQNVHKLKRHLESWRTLVN